MKVVIVTARVPGSSNETEFHVSVILCIKIDSIGYRVSLMLT
jgi:hypothetical protein